MGDTDMQEQEAPSDPDAGIQQKEISMAENDTNPNGNVGSPCPKDKTLTLTTDVHLPDVADGDTACDAKAGDDTGANANEGDGTDNAEQIDNANKSKAGDETRVDAKPGDKSVAVAKVGNETSADAMADDDTSGVVKTVHETSAVVGAGDDTDANAKCNDGTDANEKADCETNADRNADDETAGVTKSGNTKVQGSAGKSNGSFCHVDNKLGASSPRAHTEFSTPKAKAEIRPKWKTWLLRDDQVGEVDEDGTPEEQVQFIKEVESFHKEHYLDFKAPKFYGQPLNCLKLWRAVIKLGGYDVVTASKLWRQVGESFHPPKTCTTVSWTFRIFYEKALLEYEKFLRQIGELRLPGSSLPQSSSVEKEANSHPGSGSGRARRDAAARAMQGWHAQRFLGYGEVTEPIIKDKSLNATLRREKNLKSIGLPKLKTPTSMDLLEKPTQTEADKQMVGEVIDVGLPADWVKINLQETKDCFEIYALVPGLLREEVRVQSDPAGRLVITGQPEQLDNPWGVTPFKKVVSLPARIDPLHTSAVVSLHGQLFIRVPFEQ